MQETREKPDKWLIYGTFSRPAYGDTVVNTEKLTLSDPVLGNTREDTTWTNEVPSTNNTLYVAETTSGTAQMTIALDWLPANVSSNWFWWEIRQTNDATTAQWSWTNLATCATNPVTVTWTNQAAGQSNRAFKVTGWYDANTNGTLDSTEPRRQLFVEIFKVEIATDGNQDLQIDFGSTNDNHALFWINDDHDTSHYDGPLEPEWHEDDYANWAGGAGEPNWNDNTIGAKGYLGGDPPASGDNHCLRDLEDFTVVQVKVPGAVSNMTGITYWLGFNNWTTGNPSVNLFKAITNGVTGPFDYLTNGVVASNQVLETRLYTVGTDWQQISTNHIDRYDQPISFLLEGRTVGKGELTFVIMKDASEVCRASVSLELRNITDFYDIYRTGKTITRRLGFLWQVNPKWDVEVYTNAVQVQTNTAYTADSEKYLLLVHGWNMSPDDKLYFTQTAFKRLWWQGYKGGFGLYDWPGLYDCPSLNPFSLNRIVHHYDDSEMIAWLSSTALTKVMESLNGSGHLRVWAHSMGNVVFGEATRKYTGGQKVHTYIATQAAIPGSVYSQSASNTTITATTPNIHAYWYSGNTNSSDTPYLSGNAAKIDRMCNYYNSLDWALDLWELNNGMKPDGAWGYGFGYGGSAAFYDESVTATNRFYRWWGYVEGLEITTNLSERYQVFSYNVESRARALGQASNPGFTTQNRNLQDPPLQYNDKHYAHSKQFRSNIVDQKAYYEHVVTDSDF